MTDQNFSIEPQSPGDLAATEHVLDLAFGLGRRIKTSYRLREGETALAGLSFVARDTNNNVIGTISFWQIHLGDDGTLAILLGPLAVLPHWQSSGVGLALMKQGLRAAKTLGHRLVILVGDAPYYAKVGFKPVPEGQLVMPGPNDPDRLLYLELSEGALGKTSGLIRSPTRYLTAPLRNKPGNK